MPQDDAPNEQGHGPEDLDRRTDEQPATEEPTDESAVEEALDTMRGTGAGVEDPNIVGRAKPGNVEEHVQEDQPPEV